MVELKRAHDPNGYERFIIKTEEGTFKIYYGSDLCLYWSCTIPSDEDINNQYKYTITNENKKIYNIFNDLYDSVVTRTPFKHFRCGDNDKYYLYNDHGLVKGDVIEWHSDDTVYDASSFVQIEKDTENDNFIVTFNKSKVLCDDISPFSTFTVMFGTGECRYAPYNATFIEMYRKLGEYCEKRGNRFSKGSSLRKKRVRKR